MLVRTQSLVVLILSSAMLVVCLTGVLFRPAPQVEVAGSLPVTYRIDPNHADAQTLCLLPRIGPGIAHRMIDDRNANGPFRDAADLARVPMIGEKTVAALTPWLVFNTSTHE